MLPSDSACFELPAPMKRYGQVTSGFQSANIPAGLCFQIHYVLPDWVLPQRAVAGEAPA